jgi:hypothetical protein
MLTRTWRADHHPLEFDTQRWLAAIELDKTAGPAG